MARLRLQTGSISGAMVWPRTSTTSVARPLLFASWLALVLYLSLHHVVFRDEVRMLSLALDADGLVGLLHGIGDGHPVLMYLLLRGAHALLPHPEVIQIVGVSIGAAAMALLVFRAPFGLLFTGLALFGHFALYEFTVSARNYGISALLLFLIATAYPAWRGRGIGLGVLLALLANCNVHSVLLVGAFFAFWLGDLLLDPAVDRGGALRVLVVNALIAAAGVAYCIATVLPTPNDGITLGWGSAGWSALTPIRAMLAPGRVFFGLSGYDLLDGAILRPAGLEEPWIRLVDAATSSALLYASTLGLIKRPPAMIAAVLALLLFSFFFSAIYQGYYRHQALWLSYLLTMYWIVGRSEGASTRLEPNRAAAPDGLVVAAARRIGIAALTVILLLQLLPSITWVTRLVDGIPESRSRDLADLIRRTPELRDAIVMADPDYLVEPLSYYVPNETYLPREERYGKYDWFTRRARLMLSLDDLLATARQLRRQSGRPVLVLLRERLDPAQPARVVPEGYNWQLVLSPDATEHFLASVRRLARFGPVSFNDETFDVYLLGREPSPAPESTGKDSGS